jgi:sugar lactone lactonase YvrE
VFLDNGGHLFVCDTGNHRVVLYSWDGERETFLTSFGKEGSEECQFKNPCCLCVDSSNRLIVVDTWNNRVQVLDVLSFSSRVSFLCSLSLL